MLDPGWPHDEPPFHPGEQAVQRQAGSWDRMNEVGRRVIRAAMPLQHRLFFEQLPFVVLGAVDAQGQPWATLIDGAPGFVQTLDGRHLHLSARLPDDDPVAPLLRPGADLGLLGIELPTRRRNRANGHVEALDASGFTLAVEQSFGNCPKYIQRREAVAAPAAAAPPARSAGRLDEHALALVRDADTFFIATHAAAERSSGGSDVSHRGGKPGFVRVSDDGTTLAWPDFAGNGFFNTLGNLALNSRAGLVFVDFAGGGLLQLAGRAEIVWDATAVAGGERLVRFAVQAAHWRPAVLAQRWRLAEPSPALAGTGIWR